MSSVKQFKEGDHVRVWTNSGFSVAGGVLYRDCSGMPATINYVCEAWVIAIIHHPEIGEVEIALFSGEAVPVCAKGGNLWST